MKTRKRVLSSGWYPASARECLAEIEHFTRDFAPPAGQWLGGVAPHAGWGYSGQAAARLFTTLAGTAKVDRGASGIGGCSLRRSRCARLRRRHGQGRHEAPVSRRGPSRGSLGTHPARGLGKPPRRHQQANRKGIALPAVCEARQPWLFGGNQQGSSPARTGRRIESGRAV